jgi:glutathione synthase/RimK-type ligase-like ATP-grasp enzyme
VVDGTCIDLDEVTAVYWRTYDIGRIAAGLPDRAGDTQAGLVARTRSFEQGMVAWLDTVEARVINRPRWMASNNSKPYQAAVMREHGFDVPKTLVTTDPAEALRFWTDHGAVIYKSISGARSVVSRLNRSHIERIDRIAWCPTQFQQFVPGRDVRVHVVGEKVFSCEVVSDADDYRYASQVAESVQLRVSDLPDDVAARCIGLTRALGLILAGIDLRQAPDGRWFGFEVNPSPGFTYYEDHAGQPIAAAVARLLMRPASDSR